MTTRPTATWPDEFADLLTTALRRIKANENRNLDVIQDEIGYEIGREGGSFITWLRKRNLPTDIGDLEALARALTRRHALSEEELARLLRLGKHPEWRMTVRRLSMHDGHDDPKIIRDNNRNGTMPSQAAQPAQPDGAFVAGPPITRPRQFFGRERELRRIFGWWRQVPMSHVALVGPKRSGKTSLLHYLRRIHDAPPNGLRPGQKQDWLSNAQHYRWVWVDFQDARMRKLDLLLKHVLAELGVAAPVALDLDTFMDIATEPHHWRQPTIIVMDDVAAGLGAPELGQTVWDSLRALVSSATDGNLAFIVSAHDDPGRLAGEQSKTSRFFNIFSTVQLGPMTETEARELINSGPQAVPEDDIAWMLEHSGRWPLLVQILCQERQMAHEDSAADTDDAWRSEGLRRIGSYRHLIHLRPDTPPTQ